MDVSVGAEYVIANALVFLSQLGIDRISFDQIRSLGWNIQERCNEAGVDAIILTSGIDVQAAVYDFSDYFEYINDGRPMISVRKNVPIQNLENRFVYYLPKRVADVIKTATSAFLQKVS